MWARKWRVPPTKRVMSPLAAGRTGLSWAKPLSPMMTVRSQLKTSISSPLPSDGMGVAVPLMRVSGRVGVGPMAVAVGVWVGVAVAVAVAVGVLVGVALGVGDNVAVGVLVATGVAVAVRVAVAVPSAVGDGVGEASAVITSETVSRSSATRLPLASRKRNRP